MVAAKMGSAELVQALLAAGAKPALKNAHGDTAAVPTMYPSSVAHSAVTVNVLIRSSSVSTMLV